ncbi:unnamed protein product [Angiostrongylus costaricensis]|uniref:Phosphoprotein n=1 Tax=Angiostrongylus costaricensis TaxID=334426 RepID=A0A0R3PUX8_ANGCS|nr:unnamed protein product [Angiostrongylus costaricensis]
MEIIQNLFSFRDSDLTDYDISDFHGNELGFDHGSALAADVHYVVPKRDSAPPNGDGVVPARISAANRNTTGDSDDYVKVQEDPIYDTPYVDKAMSPEEAKQLQMSDIEKFNYTIDIFILHMTEMLGLLGLANVRCYKDDVISKAKMM